jgi:hypothetical protein
MEFSRYFKDRFGKEARERQATPAEAIMFVKGGDIDPRTVMARQQMEIDRLLGQDPTGKGRVAVLVPNPVWLPRYAEVVTSLYNKDKWTFTEAEALVDVQRFGTLPGRYKVQSQKSVKNCDRGLEPACQNGNHLKMSQEEKC